MQGEGWSRVEGNSTLANITDPTSGWRETCGNLDVLWCARHGVAVCCYLPSLNLLPGAKKQRKRHFGYDHLYYDHLYVVLNLKRQKPQHKRNVAQFWKSYLKTCVFGNTLVLWVAFVFCVAARYPFVFKAIVFFKYVFLRKLYYKTRCTAKFG